MSKARSPREVCSTTIGTRTEFCIRLSLQLRTTRLLFPAPARAGEQAALLLEGLGDIGDRSTPQVIYDTRPQSLPRVVHATGSAVVAFRAASDAAVVAAGAV